jgi:endo-1,4-beta-xylanase
MHSWDVVNETVEVRDFQPNGLRNTPWLRALGPEYIEMAFHAAREADPTALLVYNEDQLEPETFSADAKRRCVLSLLKNLKRKNTPVQALGIQSHISGDPNVAIAGAGFKRFLQEVSDLGLFVLVTEMDVTDQTLPADLATRDALIGDRYYRYLSTLLEFEPVTAVLTWGLSDRYTWLDKHNPRSDGLPVRPLPFDADCQPTKARDAIHRAFSEAACRSPKVSEVNQFPRVSGSVSQTAPE